MELKARSKAIEASLLAQADEAIRRGTYGPAGAVDGRAIKHCPDFPAYWVDVDGERVVGDSLVDIMARTRAFLRRKEMTMGDGMQICKRRGLTLLQYRADTDKRIQALEDQAAKIETIKTALAGLRCALDDIVAKIDSGKAELAERVEDVDHRTSDEMLALEARIARLERPWWRRMFGC